MNLTSMMWHLSQMNPYLQVALVLAIVNDPTSEFEGYFGQYAAFFLVVSLCVEDLARASMW